MSESEKGQNQKEQDEIFPPLGRLMADIEAEFEHTGEKITSGLADIGALPTQDGGEQFIEFSVENIHFAVSLKTVLEVGQLPGITPLPNLPSWVCGVSNIRGEIISVVDLKAFLGQRGSGTSGESMILLRNRDMKVGFMVDRLMGITLLSKEQLASSSNPFNEGDISLYLTGVIPAGEVLLHLLDVKKLLTSKKLNAFQKNN